MLAAVYVDESGSHDNSPVLSLAGYVFLRKKVIKFNNKLASTLRRYGLPYFHMVDCAHGRPPFDQLTMKQRIAVETRLIHLTKKYSEFGFVVSLDKASYADLIPEELKHDLGGEYSFCVRSCFTHVTRWAERTRFRGSVSYFFEAGHKYQNEANRIVQEMFAGYKVVERFRYASHTFALKRECLPLASADHACMASKYSLKKRQSKI